MGWNFFTQTVLYLQVSTHMLLCPGRRIVKSGQSYRRTLTSHVENGVRPDRERPNYTRKDVGPPCNNLRLVHSGLRRKPGHACYCVDP